MTIRDTSLNFEEKDTIEEVRMKNIQLQEEIKNLKNKLNENHEYEKKLNSEIIMKIENENKELRKLVNEYYKKSLDNWFKKLEDSSELL